MRWFLAAVIGLHGLLHLMGFVKAFGYANLEQLTQPVSRPMGVAWLAAAVLLVATAGLFATASGGWWWIGVAGVVLSQAAIITSWTDAKFGSMANLLVLVVVIHGFFSEGPFSFSAAYQKHVQVRLVNPVSPSPVTEEDLAPLPALVQEYLRFTGTIGQPRVHDFRARWRGRIRGTPDDPWMTFTAEQHNFLDEPSRFFLMDATRSGLPVDIFHVFTGNAATMRVRLFSIWPIAEAGGPDMTRAETVTLFNDVCLFAPSGLLDAAIRWAPVDDLSVRGSYTVGAETVSAVLSFDGSGALVDFVSDDRLAASPDGTQFTRQRWSTPVEDYGQFGPRRLMARGKGRWHPPGGAFTYIELELLSLETNVGR